MGSSTPPIHPTLVLAGRSVRLMAEAASHDGYRVIALDAYGDADTLRVASRWLPIGTAGRGLDAQRTLAALESLTDEPDLLGWVAGSDFECEPELLARAAQCLPLIGTAPGDVARLRDPALFFDALDHFDLPHPEVRLAAPAKPEGWLRKLGCGSGGWHIRRAGDKFCSDPSRSPYYQREQAGRPMSALFIGNGRGARLVGISDLIVRPLGALPHVYRGAVGPVELPFEQLAQVQGAIDRLTAHFSLRGLASLDFLVTDAGISLLEINPRPSGSLALYFGLWPLMRAHVEACLHHRLPLLPVAPTAMVHGTELLLARTAFTLDAAQAAALALRKDCHDLPAAGDRFEPGDPVCTLSACDASAAAVRQGLDTQRRALREQLSGMSSARHDFRSPIPESLS
jgi:predicted ATP-grasp superfamily ATP-dependent carboligase